jgi:group I intron endonuclease
MLNGKGYVGFTSNFGRRLRQHKKLALDNKGHAVHMAIRKYGWDNFVAEELYYSHNKQHTLEMENYFIDLHETKGDKGYNITRGGQQGCPSLKEEKLIAHRKRMKDPEIRRKISESLKGKAIGNRRPGFKHSEKTKIKMKTSNKGKSSEHQRSVSKEIMQGNQHAVGHTHTQEWKERQSEYMKNRDHSYKIGRKHSVEHKEKIREAMKRYRASVQK